jgi:excisionase family DNA binding protein
MISARDIRAAQEVVDDLRARGDERADAVDHLVKATLTLVERDGGPPDLLTTGQAARALGVSAQTIKNWATTGKLRAVRLGGRVMVRREDLLDYLERLRPEPAGGVISEARETSQDAAQRTFTEAGFPPELIQRLRALVAKLEKDQVLTPVEKAELSRLEEETARISSERLRAWLRRGEDLFAPET